jgi:hypothetical protein
VPVDETKKEHAFFALQAENPPRSTGRNKSSTAKNEDPLHRECAVPPMRAPFRTHRECAQEKWPDQEERMVRETCVAPSWVITSDDAERRNSP